jgi:hypothetical protein
MDVATGITRSFGARIDHYRNSSPRLIKLLGVGDQGGKIARTVAKLNRPNVEVFTNEKPVGWKVLTQGRSGERANMIVIVCAEGDERLFRPEQGKPDMLVTFVVLHNHRSDYSATNKRAANAREFADLFVTTSDIDYVAELVDNLAS